MKKVLLVILVLLLSINAFAIDNNQKIYPVDSQVYKDITTLYIVSGHGLPSTSGPWSAQELIGMVQEIDQSSLTAASLKNLHRVLKALDAKPDFGIGDVATMNFDIVANVETYTHTMNREKAESKGLTRQSLDGQSEFAFEGRDWWFGKDLSKVTPFAELKWETWVTNNLYSFMNLVGQNTYHYSSGLGKTIFNTNVMCFQNGKFDMYAVDGNIPTRAFVAFGSKNWSVQVGRDRLNWGGATTGNLAIADTMPYYDNVRATVFSKYFKYTYLISFFPNKINYYTAEGYNSYSDIDASQKGLSMYLGHRFEGRFLHDKISFAVSESVMYESRDNSMDWTLLSPMFVLHNLYISSNTNSTMTFELTATPIKRLNIYGQFLLDQLAGLGENAPGPGKSQEAPPNAIAAILGVKYVVDVLGGTLTINQEGAYIGAYTYLRNGDQGSPDFGLDYIAAIRNMEFDKSKASYNDFVVGYQYGPDCIVGALNATWEKDKWKANAKFFGILHGSHDLWTKFSKVPAGTSSEDYRNWYLTPTTDSRENNNYKYDTSGRNAKWITYDVGVGASYQLTEFFELSGSADFVMMQNIFNVAGYNANDFQFIFGAKYKII